MNESTSYTWGLNDCGQVGRNTFSNSRVQVSSMQGVSQIAAGGKHNVVLKSDGSIWSWGSNCNGQLGNGKCEKKGLRSQVNISNVKAIACGYNHSIALDSNGSVWSWGNNSNGQLGNGLIEDSFIPIKIGSISNVIAIAGGEAFTLALKKDGTVWAWGCNNYGQLGDFTNVDKRIPVQVKINGVKGIACGKNHSLALKENGTVWSWGNNMLGQLGDGTYGGFSSTPHEVSGLSNVTMITSGYEHNLVLSSDKRVWSWGNNSSGQLGNRTYNSSNLPVSIKGLEDIEKIAAGGYHSLALSAKKDLWTWGNNRWGQLGDGTIRKSNSPLLLTCMKDVSDIAAGEYHTLVLTAAAQTEIRIPFCRILELPQPFDFSVELQRGLKNLMFNLSHLQKVTEKVDKKIRDSLGNEVTIQVLQYKLVGTIEYHCAAISPLAISKKIGKSAIGSIKACSIPSHSLLKPIISTSGYIDLDVMVKEELCCDTQPCEGFPTYNLESVKIEDFTVIINDYIELYPECSCCEQKSKIIKFSGCFVFSKIQ